MYLSVSIIYVVAITLILVQVESIFRQNLTNKTRQIVSSSSLYFNSIFDQDVEILRTLKNTLEAISATDVTSEQLLDYQQKIVKNILPETPQFYSFGISWELSAVDPTYTKNHGRFRHLYYWENGDVTTRIDTFSVETEDLNSLYYFFKIAMQDDVTDIYYFSNSGKKEDEQLLNSIGIPLVKNNKFAGIISADILLERFDKVLDKVKPIPESQVFIVSHTGKIVANSNNSKNINQLISTVLKGDVTKQNILLNIKNAKGTTYYQADSLGNKNYIIFEPFYFGNIKKAWSICTVVPMQVIRKDANRVIITAVILAVVGLMLITVVILLILNAIIMPINYAVESLQHISRFDISDTYKLANNTVDEFGKIADSVNKLINSLIEIKSFTFEISTGNLDAKYSVKDEKDILGQALLEMQRSLKIARIESEKREADEKIQNWTINGESKIAEILRETSQDINQLAYKIVSYLVKYTEAAQGAMFIVEQEKKEIKLLSAYAFERRKYLKKTIPFGVGLVGRSVQEAEMIYITDMPQGYSNIGSGLGSQDPRALLIVPFQFNEVIYAVVELNTFKHFKHHVRKFVQRIGVSVASTIANLQITLQTNNLVNQLQLRSDELSAQEEEMRQSIEEMQVTQDDLQRRVAEYESIVNALNQVSYLVIYDMERKIIDINVKFLNFLGKTKDEMIGAKQGEFGIEEEQREKIENLWHNINLGRVTLFNQKIQIGAKLVKISEAYIPVLDENGKPYKVINIANNITDSVE